MNMELLLAVLTSLITSIIADEFLQWSPKLSNWIIRRSVKILPPDLRERMQEEWLAHAEAIPGKVSRLIHAVETIRAACIQGHEARLPDIPLWQMAVKRSCDIVVSITFIVLLSPIFAIITVWLWIASGSIKRVFVRDFYL